MSAPTTIINGTRYMTMIIINPRHMINYVLTAYGVELIPLTSGVRQHLMIYTTLWHQSRQHLRPVIR